MFRLVLILFLYVSTVFGIRSDISADEVIKKYRAFLDSDPSNIPEFPIFRKMIPDKTIQMAQAFSDGDFTKAANLRLRYGESINSLINIISHEYHCLNNRYYSDLPITRLIKIPGSIETYTPTFINSSTMTPSYIPYFPKTDFLFYMGLKHLAGADVDIINKDYLILKAQMIANICSGVYKKAQGKSIERCFDIYTSPLGSIKDDGFIYNVSSYEFGLENYLYDIRISYNNNLSFNIDREFLTIRTHQNLESRHSQTHQKIYRNTRFYSYYNYESCSDILEYI